jgi:hypothetical protein
VAVGFHHPGNRHHANILIDTIVLDKKKSCHMVLNYTVISHLY